MNASGMTTRDKRLLAVLLGVAAALTVATVLLGVYGPGAFFLALLLTATPAVVNEALFRIGRATGRRQRTAWDDWPSA